MDFIFRKAAIVSYFPLILILFRAATIKKYWFTDMGCYKWNYCTQSLLAFSLLIFHTDPKFRDTHNTVREFCKCQKLHHELFFKFIFTSFHLWDQNMKHCSKKEKENWQHYTVVNTRMILLNPTTKTIRFIWLFISDLKCVRQKPTYLRPNSSYINIEPMSPALKAEGRTAKI